MALLLNYMFWMFDYPHVFYLDLFMELYNFCFILKIFSPQGLVTLHSIIFDHFWNITREVFGDESNICVVCITCGVERWLSNNLRYTLLHPEKAIPAC